MPYYTSSLPVFIRPSWPGQYYPYYFSTNEWSIDQIIQTYGKQRDRCRSTWSNTHTHTLFPRSDAISWYLTVSQWRILSSSFYQGRTLLGNHTHSQPKSCSVEFTIHLILLTTSDFHHQVGDMYGGTRGLNGIIRRTTSHCAVGLHNITVPPCSHLAVSYKL